MQIEDLIGRKFKTIANDNIVYTIESITPFEKVVTSHNGFTTDERAWLPLVKVEELFDNGTWILIEEEIKTPTLEEVKEYFKNISKISCVINGETFDIEKDCIGEIHFHNKEYWIKSDKHKKKHLCVWSLENGYAKIISRRIKEEKQHTNYITREDLSDKKIEDSKSGDMFKIHEYIHNEDLKKKWEAKSFISDECMIFNSMPEKRNFTIGEIVDRIAKTAIEKTQSYSEKIQQNVTKTYTDKITANVDKSWDLVGSPTFFPKSEVDFDIEVQSTMQKIQQLLLVKGKEYRRNNNPYHNFEVAARKKNITPERALDGFLLKHIVSYDDMLNDIDKGILPKIEVVEEKFLDILVYFVIQKAQILNRIKNEKS